MDRERFLHSLASGSAGMGIHLDITALDRLYLFYRELTRWNRKVNLVSRSEPDWVSVHFLDSLAPLPMGLLKGNERVVDLGAGAGFPGIPLKVAAPGITLSLAEASGRKCAWMRHLIRTLDLGGVKVLEGRFDDLPGDAGEPGYDLAVSRAAARPVKMIRQAERFLTGGGRLLIYTTEGLVERDTGRIHPYRVPGSKKPSVVWEVTY